MKKRFACCLALALLFALATPAFAANLDVNAKAVVLMEKTTGEVLYEENAHEQLEPASVTKVMTMLLIMEALDSGVITKDTMIPVSATAAGMGGSQVYLKEGEEFPVEDFHGEMDFKVGGTKKIFGDGGHRVPKLYGPPRRGAPYLRL